MKYLFLAALISTLSFSATARDSSSGCGPGWYVVKENSLVSSALRATTNGFFFPTTTLGMTLGTSNCTKHKIVKTEKKSLHFVSHNLYEMKSEAAQGVGSYISALGEVIGCSKSGQKQFNNSLKSNYQNVFKSDEPQEVLKNIYQVILQDEKLVQSCSLS